MDTAFLEAIAKWGVLPAIALYAISKLLPQLFAARTDAAGQVAKTDVIAMLSDRVAKLEAAQSAVWEEYANERKMRMEAEDKVAQLTRRVSALEAQVRSLGGTV